MPSSSSFSRLLGRAADNISYILACVALLLSCSYASFAQQQALDSLRWQPTKGVEGGNVSDLVSAGSRLYASTDIGIFRSDNEGNSWTLLPNDVINRPVRLAAKGTDVYAYVSVSTIDFSPLLRFSPNQGESGVLRSRDGGMTWQPVGTGVLSNITQILTTDNAIFAVKSTRLPLVSGVANATQTIFRSTDDGATWQQIRSLENVVINWRPNGSTVYAFTATQTIAANGRTLVAVAQGQGILRSEDNGTTWQNVSSMTASAYYTSIMQANNQFFVTEKTSNNSTQGVRIFRSSDGGKTWLLAPSSSGLSYAQFSHMISLGSVLFAVASNIFNLPSTFNVFYRHENILRSTDNGASWSSTTALNLEFGAFARCVTVIGPRVLLGTDVMGILRPINIGMSWERLNTGLLNAYHKRGTANTLGAFNVRGTTLYAQTAHGVWKTDDKGETWIEIVTPEGREGLFGSFATFGRGFTTSHLQTDNVKFAVAVQGQFSWDDLKRSLDGGKTWRTIVDAGELTNPLSLSVNARIETFAAQNPQILYVGVRELTSGSFGGGATSVPSLFASASGGGSFTSGSSRFELYRSTNGGATWAKAQKINDLGIDILYATESEVYAILNSNRRIYRSTDNGSTWKSIASQTVFAPNQMYDGIPFINDFIINNNVFYIASSTGVYYSTDKGGTFRPINTGLPMRTGSPMQVSALAVLGSTIFAATENSVYRAALPPTFFTTPQQISLGGTLFNGITTGATFTVEGTNVAQPISITAPSGILLYNPSTRTWGQSLTIPSNGAEVVNQRVAVRLDSSRVGLVGRIGTVGQQAFISVSSGSLSAPVEVSGNVQEPPFLSVQPSALDFGTARLGNASPFTLPLQRSYTITGTNLSETLVITAPDGMQLFDTVSRSWQQTLRFPLALMPFAANFRTTLQARMDSSRLGTIAAPILHRSGSAQVSVGVSGAVIPLPELQVSRQSLPAFPDVILGDPALTQQYSVSGTNLAAPVAITAPEGILLFNAATSTWTRTLTFAPSQAGSLMQTISVRLDSSQIRSIVNQEIIHQSTGTQATVRVSGAVVPLFLPMGAETTLELRLAMPRQTPFLIRDTARVQLWLKESRLLTPRLIARFVKNLRVTLKLDTNNFNVVGFATPASIRAVSQPSPRTSSLTTFTIERIDTSTTREMLLAELLLQAAVGATTTNTIRTAQPTEWLGNATANTTRITWATDSLRLEIRPLFAPRRQNSLAAVVAPNPSSGEVELRYTLSPTMQGAEPLTLVVSDMAGRVVHEQELGKRKTGEAQRETVLLRGLAAASYQVMLVAPSEVLHGRVDIVR